MNGEIAPNRMVTAPPLVCASAEPVVLRTKTVKPTRSLSVTFVPPSAPKIARWTGAPCHGVVNLGSGDSGARINSETSNGPELRGKRSSRSSSVSANNKTISLFSVRDMASPPGNVKTSPSNKAFTSSRFSPMIRCCVFSSSTATAFMANKEIRRQKAIRGFVPL